MIAYFFFFYKKNTNMSNDNYCRFLNTCINCKLIFILKNYELIVDMPLNTKKQTKLVKS